ncbi:MAG TPA: 30S ribosomal protein S14 [Candidatus Nanoarchaeia archaeon]|nr:30S ribosomal protein S14 [Candidatus Nanoarchaeia archaeon]
MKLEKFKKHNSPKERKFGRISKRCVRCGRMGGHIGKYGLHLCRQCFREIAKKIGFKKFS